MHTDQVKKLKWLPVKNWKQLTQTKIGHWSDNLVGKEDVDNFVENLFRDVSRKLNIDYSDLEPILIEENTAFFEMEDRVFELYGGGLTKRHALLVELQNMLRIPDTSSIPDYLKESKVEKLLSDFFLLSKSEQIEVLQRLGLITVKITKN